MNELIFHNFNETADLVGGDMTVPYAGITDHQMVFEVTANG